jgi:hypothetical protein
MVELKGKKPLVPDKGYIKAFELFVTVKCRNCGRTLRSEESIKRGFGPTCGQEFGMRFLNARPTFLGERAKRTWTKEDISKLIKFARTKK